MAYLTEMQGERSEEYQLRLKGELNHYFTEALPENRIFAFLAEQDNRAMSFGATVLKKNRMISINLRILKAIF